MFNTILACKEEQQLRKLIVVKFSSINSQESDAGLNLGSKVDSDGRNTSVITIIASMVVLFLFSWVLGSLTLYFQTVGIFLKEP